MLSVVILLTIILIVIYAECRYAEFSSCLMSWHPFDTGKFNRRYFFVKLKRQEDGVRENGRKGSQGQEKGNIKKRNVKRGKVERQRVSKREKQRERKRENEKVKERTRK